MRIWPAIFVFAGVAVAQEFEVSGTVVNSVTGAPIAGALVGARAIPDNEKGAKGSGVAMSEAGGAFRIGSLPPGHYIVTVEKPGFTQEQWPAVPPVEIGPSRDGLVAKLKPYGKIFGAVTDRDGAPISHAAVRAFRAQILEGRRKWTQARSVATDDLGHYRLWNLEPGDYYVLAAGRSGGTALVVGHTAATVNSHESFAPAYYGGGTDRATAVAIPLAAGQEFEAKIKATLQPAYRVRGRIQNASPYQQLKVELLRDGQDVSATRAQVNAANGLFDLQDVVSGSYVVRVSQTSGDVRRVGERIIEVADRDLDGVAITLADPVEVVANVRFVGAERPVQRQGRGFFILEDGDRTFPSFAQEDRWVVSGVAPGRYKVRIAAYSGYVSSAMAGNQDLLQNPEVVVPAGAPPLLEIVIDLSAGTLRGRAPAAERSYLLLVPSRGNEPQMQSVFGAEILVGRLAPGDYEAFLLKDGDIEYRNPEVVRRLGRGVPVHIEKGTTTTVEFKEFHQ